MISDKYKNLRATVRILFRAPDTLTLYGIPYEMREGQQPGDLWRSRRISSGPREDWIYLGEPGWWSTPSTIDKDAAYAFLATLPKDLIPGGPYEWTRLAEDAL